MGFIILVCLIAVAVMVGISVEINTLFVHPSGKDKLTNHQQKDIDEVKLEND